jgi:hypothetical protein
MSRASCNCEVWERRKFFALPVVAWRRKGVKAASGEASAIQVSLLAFYDMMCTIWLKTNNASK